MRGGIELSSIGDKSLNDLGALSFRTTFAGTIEVFKILNPTGERKINLNFSASPVGSVKAFENLVEQ